MRLALFEPDIPQNTGALLRLAACFAVEVDLIEPFGFVLDDRRLRLVAAVWSAILLTAPGDFGPDTDWQQVDIDILVDLLNDTYKQFIDICTGPR